MINYLACLMFGHDWLHTGAAQRCGEFFDVHTCEHCGARRKVRVAL